jgi:hypothetical protein
MIRSLPRLLLGGVLVVALAAVAVIGSQLSPRALNAAFVPPPPPSEAAARAVLDRAVTYARAYDFAGLCSLSDGNCPIILQQAGRDAVPLDPPIVYGTRILQPTQLANGGWDAGGRVPQVCGIDGRGRPYRSEVLAFTSGSTVTLINPVYWSGMGIASVPHGQAAPSIAAGAEPGSSVGEGCPGG